MNKVIAFFKRLSDFIKSNEPLYRSIRTFAEAALGVMLAYATERLGALEWTGEWKTGAMALLVLAFATGATAVVNPNKNAKKSPGSSDISPSGTASDITEAVKPDSGGDEQPESTASGESEQAYFSADPGGSKGDDSDAAT